MGYLFRYCNAAAKRLLQLLRSRSFLTDTGKRRADKKILVAGDSHCVILAGVEINSDELRSKYPEIDICWIGPGLAYKLGRASSVGADGKILGHLRNFPDAYQVIVLSFGEIDCRVHCIRQAELQKKAIEDVVSEIAETYVSFARKLASEFKAQIVLWGPIATGPDGDWPENSEFPKVGSVRDRNMATLLLNNKLSEIVRHDSHIHHVSIFDKLVDTNLNTLSLFYKDGCHLNQQGFALVRQELGGYLKRLGVVAYEHESNLPK